MPRMITLEEKADALVARMKGIPYEDVVVWEGKDEHNARFDAVMTPNQFHNAVQDIEELAGLTSNTDEQAMLLDMAVQDRRMQTEMYNMGPNFLMWQYSRIEEGTQKKFFDGTRTHPENIKTIVYYALTKKHPKLGVSASLEKDFQEMQRKQVTNAIKKELPTNLQDYFYKLHLKGVMKSLEGNGKGSPLAVLRIYDEVYREITGDLSLFDARKKHHLHPWGGKFSAPQSYWDDPLNQEKAVYHTLTEHADYRHLDLKKVMNSRQPIKKKREAVIDKLKELPPNLARHLQSIGLNTLMKKLDNSPIEVLKVFDRVYMQKTGDKSLFDLEEDTHMHPWGNGLRAPNKYWKNNRQRQDAVYHVMTRHFPGYDLSFIHDFSIGTDEKRYMLTEILNNLPYDTKTHFRSDPTLRELMHNFYRKPRNKMGHLAPEVCIIKDFDVAYKRRHDDYSLFHYGSRFRCNRRLLRPAA